MTGSGFHLLPREAEIEDDLPREVIDMALAAFDTRRPGVEVLALVSDTHGSGGAPREMSFRGSVGGNEVTVRARVALSGDHLQVRVPVPGSDVPDSEDVALTLEQLDPSGQLVQHRSVSSVFEPVCQGFTRVVASRPGSSLPVWCTAWTLL